MNYKLEGHTPVLCVNLFDWAMWFEKADRIVRQDETPKGQVSTVFLGTDHSFGRGEPLLFETMVFGGPLDGEMDRYTTWEQSEAGHAAMLARVMGASEESATDTGGPDK